MDSWIQMKKSNNKVALVTGAGAGIGRAVALQLARDGFDLTINDVRNEPIQAVAKEVEEIGVQCLAVTADVTNETQVQKMVDFTMEKYGRIDVLVNNAGICPIRSLFDITPENMLQTLNVNVVSVLICVKAVAQHMIKQGKGKIINAASQSSFRQSENSMEYGASKWAMRGFTRSLALYLAKHNITVNAYCPGTVASEMQDNILAKISQSKGTSPEEVRQTMIKAIPLGRYQPAEDIAKLVSYLASDAADNMTGQNILLNGGQVMN